MRVGIFLDVDGVLTLEPANMQLARHLGVWEELALLEKDYAAGKIQNDAFNSGLIPLFQKAGLTRRMVKDLFDSIRMRLSSEKLLHRDDLFLVSSGPSYFVDALAEKHGIPADHVMCTKYEFDDGADGLIARCSDPVGSMRKADWVHQRVREFDIAVGVGDTPEVDGQFLSHCAIRVLVGDWRIGYLGTKELEPIVALLETLGEMRNRPPAVSRQVGRPRVFIGSSHEAKGVAQAVQAALEEGQVETTVWNQLVFPLSSDSLDSLLQRATRTDFAVLILAPDDVREHRGERASIPRDNVILECGLFIGSLGRRRVFLIVHHDVRESIPSDLAGVTVATYRDRQDGNVRAAVGPACMSLLEAIASFPLIDPT